MYTGATGQHEIDLSPVEMNISNLIDVQAKYMLGKDGKVYYRYLNSQNEFNKQYEKLPIIEKIYQNGLVDKENNFWTTGSLLLQDKGKKILLTKSKVSNIKEFNPYGMYITKENKIYGWGNNSHGQIQNTSIKAYTDSVLIDLPTGITIEQIKSNNRNSYIIDTNHNLWFRGANGHGEAGIGTSSDFAKLTEYTLNTLIDNVKQIYPINLGNFVQKTDNTLWYTGNNNNKESGVGTSSLYNRYVQLTVDNQGNNIDFSLLSKIEGLSSVVALMKDGNAYVWGNNSYGQLGLGSNTNIVRPTKLDFFKDKGEIIDIAVGEKHIAYMLKNGDVYTSGDNSYGQLGIGNRISSTVPVKVNISNVKEIHAGKNHTIAVTKDNKIYSWGAGSLGQLGTRKLNDELTPVEAIELEK